MPPQSPTWRHHLWLALLVAGSLVFSLGLACAAPLAGFAAAAAVTLPRREALVLTGAVWLANQAVGFAFLGYPLTANCLIWGVVLGAAAFAAASAAGEAAARGGAIVAFVAGFAVYELVLYVAAVTALGGVEDFAPAILGWILLVNAGAFAAVLAAGWIAERAGLPAWPMLASAGRRA